MTLKVPKSTKDLERIAERLRKLNVQVTVDGRPYRAPIDYLRDDGVRQQIRDFAARGIGRRSK